MKNYEQPIVALMPLKNEDVLTMSDNWEEDIFDD